MRSTATLAVLIAAPNAVWQAVNGWPSLEVYANANALKNIPTSPLAVVATQIVAVLMCAFGILVPQLPWTAIGAVWLYALAWMVVIDLVKLLYVRIQDGREAREAVLHQPIAGGQAT